MAWHQSEQKRQFPVRVEELRLRRGTQKNPKSHIYRLHGIAGKEKPVIAKLCKTEAADIERRIYQHILSQLPVRVPELYGARLAEDESKTWLFLEDAGESRFAFKNPPCRQLAVEFLAVLHTDSQRISEIQSLPDVGIDRSLARLQSLTTWLEQSRNNPALDSAAHTVLDTANRYCSILTESWDEIEKLYEPLPRTLVHGDFKPNNTRIVQQPSSQLLVFDWEMAGIGMPGLDLATARLSRFPSAAREYFRLTREAWPDLGFDEIEMMVNLGSIFRAIALADWNCTQLTLQYPHKSIAQLELCCQKFERAFSRIQWRIA